MNIESLISDLAFILLLGAIVTVLFKWLKQPVVLGYIVAGFLASPNFKALPSVTTLENIDFWAELGIVVLLFSLGLEFSFKKLVNSGGSAVVTALIIVTGMMCAGIVVGHVLDFNFINSLFLGGMLSMSSTTIIIKAFTDMGLRQQKFASQVLAVLIVEDLFAVVMMVVLSSIAINNTVEGSEMLMSIGKLLFFLMIWFLVGVYVLPSLLNRWRRFLNAETLLVVSMGLCLGMAVFSVYCGFSLALGAFVMGSILAGTSYAENIEHVTTPVKDLFGSVFFISVGMMVQPDILVKYWLPIIILSLVVIVGMIVFGTAGMLITGQTLRTAIRSGFSLTQIGEFAFIIASLGMSLKVLEPELYPIVVAVSVITTFTTPYFIKMSLPVYDFVAARLPERLKFLIDRNVSESEKERASGNPWGDVFRVHLGRTVVYLVILLAITIGMDKYVRPWFIHLLPHWGKLISLAATLVVMAPFLIALVSPVRMHKKRSKQLNYNIPCIVLTVFRTILALGFTVHAVSLVYPAKVSIAAAMVVILAIGLIFYKRISHYMRGMETKFIDNLNERDLRRSGKNNQVVSDLHLAYMTVGNDCRYAGERMMDSNLRRRYGVNIVSIQRGGKTIPIPNGRERLFPGDVVGVIGTDEQIARILPVIEKNDSADSAAGPQAEMQLRPVLLSFNSPLIDKTPSSSSLRDNYDVLVVAVNRNGQFIDSNPNLVFAPGDIVWVAGAQQNINRLK